MFMPSRYFATVRRAISTPSFRRIAVKRSSERVLRGSSPSIRALIRSRIAVAEGRLGTNLEYLENLLASLHVLGIEDPEMAELLEATLEVRREMGVE